MTAADRGMPAWPPTPPLVAVPMTPAGLAALTTVLPPDLPLWPVGGIVADNMAAWRRAGATGFGLGGGLFRPEFSVADIAARARACVDAWQASRPSGA